MKLYTPVSLSQRYEKHIIIRQREYCNRRVGEHPTFPRKRVFHASNMEPMANIKGNTTADIRRREPRPPSPQRKSQRWRNRIRKNIMQDRRHNGTYPLYGFRMWQRTEIRIPETPSFPDTTSPHERRIRTSSVSSKIRKIKMILLTSK